MPSRPSNRSTRCEFNSTLAIAMNIDLKELGITLVVGAYVLYGLELLGGLLFEKNLFKKLRAAELVSETGSVAVSLALSFAIGMIMESTAAFYLRGPGSSIKLFESTMIRQVVDRNTGELTPLGLEVTGNHLLSLAGGAELSKVETEACKAGIVSDSSEMLLDRGVSRLYYHAKNTLYGHPQYSSELLNVQQRMNFSSAFAGCSVVLLIAFVLLALVRTRLFSNRKALPKLRIAALLAAFIAGIGGTSLFTYTRESGEYTRRVLGYYSSTLVEAQMALRRDSVASATIPVGDVRITTDTLCLRGILRGDANVHSEPKP